MKLNSALWSLKIAFKVSTGLTPFKLVYGLETLVPMEYLKKSLRIEIIDNLILKEFVKYRVENLLQLEANKIESAYVASVIHNKRASWLNNHLKKKIFKPGNLVLIYNSKLGKHPGKL